MTFLSRLPEWNSKEVAEFIALCGFEQYARNFQEAEIDGKNLILLTAPGLEKIGVTLLGHRKRILFAVQTALRRSDTGETDPGNKYKKSQQDRLRERVAGRRRDRRSQSQPVALSEEDKDFPTSEHVTRSLSVLQASPDVMVTVEYKCKNAPSRKGFVKFFVPADASLEYVKHSIANALPQFECKSVSVYTVCDECVLHLKRNMHWVSLLLLNYGGTIELQATLYL